MPWSPEIAAATEHQREPVALISGSEALGGGVPLLSVLRDSQFVRSMWCRHVERPGHSVAAGGCRARHTEDALVRVADAGRSWPAQDDQGRLIIIEQGATFHEHGDQVAPARDGSRLWLVVVAVDRYDCTSPGSPRADGDQPQAALDQRARRERQACEPVQHLIA